MKLIFDGNIFGDGCVRTGIFVVAWNLFKELLDQTDVEITVYVDVGNMVSAKTLLQNEIKNNKWNILYEDLGFVHMLSKLCGLFPKGNYFFVKALKRIMDLISYLYLYFSPKAKRQLRNYDIFFSPQKIYPNIIKREEHIKKIIFLHDTILYKFPEYYPQIRWYSFRIRNLLKDMNEKDYYFANSLCTKKDFLELTEKVADDQITVVPLACDEKFKRHEECKLQILEKYHIPFDKKYIFSLCSIEPRKNLIRAIKTFLAFIEKNNISDMVYVLGGAEWDSFAEQFNKEKVSNETWRKYVIQIGYVEDEDLPYLYSNAQWFVYTSQYEGFGLPPLEAMSCGCPVIVSNNSSLPEVVGKAGILIQWDSDEEHVQAYERYYYDEELRYEMREKGFKQVCNFSWKNAGNIITSRMKELMGEEVGGYNR